MKNLKSLSISIMLICSVFNSKAQTWDTLHAIPIGANFYDFISHNDTLFMVGNISGASSPFDTIGTGAYGWNGETISFYKGKLRSAAYCIDVYNNRLYIGGAFKDPQNNPNGINKLAVWNGTKWEKFGNAVMGAGRINQFKVYRDTLYIGGDYGININGIDDGFLVKWNDTSFYTFPSMQTYPTGIEVYNDVLYAGLYSCFSVGSGQYVCNLGKYSGQAWSNVYDKNGNLFQSCVNSMLTDTINNDLYIACISIYRYDGEFFHHIGGAGSQVNTHA
ncbi:MAG: hypothetical protein GX879_01410, partial [Bacteroidales bacterium]|nr:hypothetical protein [Bacteroidales bacterium]